ncbi:hypothetical protein [Ornithinimicrobium cryptoxanthini]|uniref:hypothetical protein n=1 Tax=Ornithinimicrobium cryptoxanthini TaxID=2934161 RepID=UPI0021193DA9|nr:hypothetical protein [Ornithinimicrobium cryptoxanthini]
MRIWGVGVVLLVGLAACQPAADPQVVGRAGVSVGADGVPVAHFVTCGESFVAEIEVRLRDGVPEDEIAPLVGSAVPADSFERGQVVLGADVVPKWDPDLRYWVEAEHADGDEVIEPAVFQRAHLDHLADGQVIAGDGETVRLELLHTC